MTGLCIIIIGGGGDIGSGGGGSSSSSSNKVVDTLNSWYIKLYSIVTDNQTTVNWQGCVSKWVWPVLVIILYLSTGLNSGPT